MITIKFRLDALKELLLLLCLEVLLGASLGLLKVEAPALWFAMGSVPMVLWVSYRLQRIGELELARMLRLFLIAFVGGAIGANLSYVFSMSI